MRPYHYLSLVSVLGPAMPLNEPEGRECIYIEEEKAARFQDAVDFLKDRIRVGRMVNYVATYDQLEAVIPDRNVFTACNQI
jgi:hypothetical protein